MLIYHEILFYGSVLVKDMQSADLTLPQKEQYHFFVQIAAQCSETNEKSIFIF